MEFMCFVFTLYFDLYLTPLVVDSTDDNPGCEFPLWIKVCFSLILLQIAPHPITYSSKRQIKETDGLFYLLHLFLTCHTKLSVPAMKAKHVLVPGPLPSAGFSGCCFR